MCTTRVWDYDVSLKLGEKNHLVSGGIALPCFGFVSRWERAWTNNSTFNRKISRDPSHPTWQLTPWSAVVPLSLSVKLSRLYALAALSKKKVPAAVNPGGLDDMSADSRKWQTRAQRGREKKRAWGSSFCLRLRFLLNMMEELGACAACGAVLRRRAGAAPTLN